MKYSYLKMYLEYIRRSIAANWLLPKGSKFRLPDPCKLFRVLIEGQNALPPAL